MQVAWKETAGILEGNLHALCEKGKAYREHLRGVVAQGGYTSPESALNAPADRALMEELQELVTAFPPAALKHVLVIGIGGSSLGAKAVYHALYGYTDALDTTRFPKAIFVETIDESYLHAVIRFLTNCNCSSEEIVIVVVSKSGTTTETVANTALLREALLEMYPDIEQRMIVVSDRDTPLQAYAEGKHIRSLTMPGLVGGRYSVFTAAGLVPLALLGVDVKALVLGAQETTAKHLEGDIEALETGAVLAHYHQGGYRVHDTFLFQPRLEFLGMWYRQLLAESIGKERSDSGATIRVGLTPTVSIGTTDLHSVAQLRMAGPRDTITTFVQTQPLDTPMILPTDDVIALAPMLSGKTTLELRSSILQAVEHEYQSAGLPFISFVLGADLEHELGAFMQYKMLETMYLGAYLEVNAFDQPAVEGYKQEVRHLLTT